MTVVHDLSDGGLMAATAEMALASGVGVTLAAQTGMAAHGFLLGEDQGRYLLATATPDAVVAQAKAACAPIMTVGAAGGRAFSAADLFSIPLTGLRQANEAWMPAYMGGAAD